MELSEFFRKLSEHTNKCYIVEYKNKAKDKNKIYELPLLKLDKRKARHRDANAKLMLKRLLKALKLQPAQLSVSGTVDTKLTVKSINNMTRVLQFSHPNVATLLYTAIQVAEVKRLIVDPDESVLFLEGEITKYRLLNYGLIYTRYNQDDIMVEGYTTDSQSRDVLPLTPSLRVLVKRCGWRVLLRPGEVERPEIEEDSTTEEDEDDEEEEDVEIKLPDPPVIPPLPDILGLHYNNRRN